MASRSSRARGLKPCWLIVSSPGRRSRSLRARGLKLRGVERASQLRQSRSSRTRGLKHPDCRRSEPACGVALFTSAWIETAVGKITWSCARRVALFPRAWIETYEIMTSEPPRFSWRLLGLSYADWDGLIGELPVVVCLTFGRRKVADRFQQSMVVKPGYPFQRGELHILLGLPGSSTMNQLGFAEPIDSLCQGVDVTVAPAAHRRFDAGLGQALTVSNRRILGEFNLSLQHLQIGGVKCEDHGVGRQDKRGGHRRHHRGGQVLIS